MKKTVVYDTENRKKGITLERKVQFRRSRIRDRRVYVLHHYKKEDPKHKNKIEQTMKDFTKWVLQKKENQAHNRITKKIGFSHECEKFYCKIFNKISHWYYIYLKYEENME